MKIFETEKKNRGFTLVETLVAIGILSLSILGTFTAVQQGLQSSGFAKDQITAFYLIQDAMEYMRNVRDQNGLISLNNLANGNPRINWLTGLSAVTTDPCWWGGSGTAQKTCTVDSPHPSGQTAVIACSGDFVSCPVIKQDTTTGLYGYTSSWTNTRFTRSIKITQIASNEATISIWISWKSGPFVRTIQIDQLLFDVN